MTTFFMIVTFIAMFLVVLFLGRGLLNMMRGGNPEFSNKMMQGRIAFQALAIVLIMVTLWLVQSSH